MKGTMTPKAMRNGPTSRTSRSRRATRRPISSKKKERSPLNRPLMNGAIASPPAGPLMNPTTIEPIKRRFTPSVNASRKTSLMEIGGSVSTPPSSGPRTPAACGASGTSVLESAVASLSLRIDAAGVAAVATLAFDVFNFARTQVARSTAMMMAGDSIKTIATVMWPPASSPRDTRNCDAVTNVTALTDP